MMIKYRVSEVAKDLGEANNKSIIDLLQKYTGESKKAMTALSDEELNIVFEYYTQKNSVKSFDEYFKTGEASRKAREEEKAKIKAQRAAEQERIAEMLRAAKAQADAAKNAAERRRLMHLRHLRLPQLRQHLQHTPLPTKNRQR